MRGLWQFTAVSAVIGGLLIVFALFAESAPQQAALAAVGVGFAVAPYVYTRAMQEMEKTPQAPAKIKPVEYDGQEL
jgi:hypothetical protein